MNLLSLLLIPLLMVSVSADTNSDDYLLSCQEINYDLVYLEELKICSDVFLVNNCIKSSYNTPYNSISHK